MSDKKKNIPKVETRYHQVEGSIEVREAGEEGQMPTVVIYPAVFDKWSEPIMGWFRESIAPGAFDDVLQDSATVCLFNHDKNFVLARNLKSMKLSVDSKGLRAEFQPPKNVDGERLLEQIERGDIEGGSFRFKTKEAKWETAGKGSAFEDVEELRTILKVEQLIDVGPVTYPAYKDTDVEVAKREAEEFRSQQQEEQEQQMEEPDDEINIALAHAEAELQMRKHIKP